MLVKLESRSDIVYTTTMTNNPISRFSRTKQMGNTKNIYEKIVVITLF